MKANYISSMAALEDLVKSNLQSNPKFKTFYQDLAEFLCEGFDKFSQKHQLTSQGELAWGMALFLVNTLSSIRGEKLEGSQVLEKTLFVASAIYLASTNEISDVLNATE